jgi:hypothetical protein
MTADATDAAPKHTPTELAMPKASDAIAFISIFLN